MAVGGIKSLGSINPTQYYGIGKVQPDGQNFAKQLQQAIQDVNGLQETKADKVDDMVAGRASEVHDVMIAARESQLAFELLLEVRNKLLEGYQELMRLQV